MEQKGSRASMTGNEEVAWTTHALGRERAQTRLFIWLATLLVPAWIPFDHLLEPTIADQALWLRLFDVAVGVVLLFVLQRCRTLGQVRTVAVLKLVSTGATIAFMLPLVTEHYWPYVLGFSLVFWGTAAIFSLPVTPLAVGSALVLAALALALALRPEQRSFDEVVGGAFFLLSAVIICLAQVGLRRRLEWQAFLSSHRLAEASRKVLEQEELKTQFFANVSHELRTPLTLILGPAEKLLSSHELPEAERADIELMRRNARMLLAHVNDLLDVARLEGGATRLDLTRTDLAELVRASAGHFDGVAAERGIRWLVEVPEALSAEVDRKKLQRVLVNLLSNAFKVTPAGGQIRCTLRGEGERAVLEVADSGPGIRPEHRQLIFERFRQIEGGATRKLGGTGLGLAIAKDFVALHDGDISVADATEGGASFRVELPLRARPGAEVHDEEDRALGSFDESIALAWTEPQRDDADLPEERSGEAPLVLVVEDNPELNRFVRESLSADYRTAAALDGRAGLDKAMALKPDLIITDIMMPELSGDELVDAMRARAELDAVPLLVLSAKSDDAVRIRLLEEGAQDYLTKPFSAQELRARAANLVATGRARGMLQEELQVKDQSLEALAREVGRQRRELNSTLESMRVAREQAERASELKTSFLRLVSHELRSPLTALLLQLQRMQRPATEPLSADKQQLLERMARSAERLRDLIEGLLEYARIQSGKLPTEIETFDIVALAREALLDVAPQAQDKGLALDLEQRGEVSELSSDPRLVRLILVNLLINAIKFTAAGSVTIVIECEGANHRLSVCDTGHGIPPDARARIFEPFEQVSPVRAKHLPGVGLGLALVKEMASALGGTVAVDSVLGSGTTFVVTLPAVDQPSLSEDSHAEHRVASRG